MIYTVWLDDRNPHIKAACRIYEGRPDILRYGATPYRVEADDMDAAWTDALSQHYRRKAEWERAR